MGTFANYSGEFADGDWTFQATDVFPGADNGTLNEWCLGLSLLLPREFLRGDVDANGTVAAILDVQFLLNWQFNLGPEPTCFDTADVNDDGVVSAIQDALALLTWQFLTGPEPADPGPTVCGVDPTNDDVDCAVEPVCL